MKKIHYLIFSFFALGCNSKLENSNSIAVKPTINIKKENPTGQKSLINWKNSISLI
jgi:hypothetical protein